MRRSGQVHRHTPLLRFELIGGFVETKAISVNFADVMTRERTYPVMPPVPAVIGLEGSAVVMSVVAQRVRRSDS